MLGILSAPKEVIKANLKLLANDYKEKTGRVVCLSCPSDIAYMISSLKLIYKMNNFEFKKNAAQYKNLKGDKTTISNGTMTDEKAIEFLKTNPERIVLFSKYPENWESLIKEVSLTEEELAEKNAEEAAEAEALNASFKNKGSEGLEDIVVNKAEILSPEEEAMKASEEAAEAEAASVMSNEKEECCDEEHADAPCEECKEKKRQELMKIPLKELRLSYPEIKATSIKDFVDKIVN